MFFKFQALTAEDLYWEGEEDASNEFLEVKDEPGVIGHLKRLKRDFDFWSKYIFYLNTHIETS